MNLFQFCDLRFQNTSVAQSQGFSIARDGETKALLFLLNSMRTFYKFAYVPYLLFIFVLVNLRVLKAPTSPIAAMVKASESKAAAKQPAQAPAPKEGTDAKVLSDAKV